MPIFAVAEWRVAHLRLTTFPATPQRTLPTDVWLQTLGSEPETKTTRSIPAQIDEAGDFLEQGRLQFVSTPIRSDWRLVAKPTASPQLDSLGSLPDVVAPFVDLCRKWLAQTDKSNFTRIAFGGLLFNPNESIPVCKTRLAAFLTHTLHPDLEFPDDFLFQMNRPVPSTVLTGLEINRLSKWLLQSTLLRNLQGGEDIVSYAASCELDINTSPSHTGPLPQDSIQDLFESLVGQFLRVAEEGDAA